MNSKERPADQTNDSAANAPEALLHLAYVSTQARLLSGAELLALLEKARSNNRRLGVTGLLLHKEDAFFQVLEGPEAAVRSTFRTIMADERHKNIELMLEEPLNDRQFPDWQMGFSDLDNIDTSLVPGFSDFMNEARCPRRFLEELSASKRLAVMFRDLQ